MRTEKTLDVYIFELLEMVGSFAEEEFAVDLQVKSCSNPVLK